MYAYIGRKDCGCVTCLCVDVPTDEKYTAAIIAEWIKEGKKVERMSVEAAKLHLMRCPHIVKQSPRAK